MCVEAGSSLFSILSPDQSVITVPLGQVESWMSRLRSTIFAVIAIALGAAVHISSVGSPMT